MGPEMAFAVGRVCGNGDGRAHGRNPAQPRPRQNQRSAAAGALHGGGESAADGCWRCHSARRAAPSSGETPNSLSARG